MGTHRKGREIDTAPKTYDDAFADEYGALINARQENPGAYEPLSWGRLAKRGLATAAILGLLVAGAELADKEPGHSVDHSVDH